jgi:fumarate reductase flavoprotein subunit
MELGPARPAEPGLLAREAEGPHRRRAAWRRSCTSDLRHLGEKKLRERLPQIYELAVEYLRRRPGASRPIPGAARGCTTRWAHRRPTEDRPRRCRAVIGGRMFERRHPRRQPALGSISLTSCSCSDKLAGRRSPAAYCEDGETRHTRPARRAREGRARPAPSLRRRTSRDPNKAPSASPRCAARWHNSMEDGCGIYQHRPRRCRLTCD